MSRSEASARVLIVDDHEEMAAGLADYLNDVGYDAETATSGEAALARIGSSSFDALITDLRMPDMDGIRLLKAVHQQDPAIPVFIMTAFGSIENAIEAVRQGAYHYFSKPLKVEEVLVYLERALEFRRLHQSQGQLLKDIAERYTFESMVGRSPQMRQIFDLIERVADSPASVLITGESGTGKELIARAIHFRGQRARRAFVPVNCAAIPANLLESELFGYEKGAFTGATRPRAGLAVEASGGTLFLDEIGEMPLELQPKVLRLLQEGEVRPLGADSSRRVEVRVVAASNADLEQMVEQRRFRKDLYYRLNVVPVLVPPLAERSEDIPILAERLLQRVREANPRLIARRLSAEAVEHLMSRQWPGNVRELENAIERAATLCNGETIEASDLRFLEPRRGEDGVTALMDDLPSLRELEQRYIEAVLAKVDGNKVKASAILGIDPSTLYRRGKQGPVKK